MAGGRGQSSVVHEPSGLESFESGGASSPSPLESLGGSRVLAGAVAAWALLCAERNFTQNKRYMASGNKSTVFIFKWRVFNFCLVVSKEKGSMQRHPESSELESARFRSSPGANWAREQH